VLCGLPAQEHARWTHSREAHLLETVRPGLFAAGDVRSGSTKRVASAVGDGSLVVRFAHEVLEGG
jgi:thioredoxin reductase (NADPH)